jgi:ATP synthase protein I
MNGKSTAYRIALAQLVATLLVGLLLYGLRGAAAATAAVAGGGIAVVNNLLFAWRVFGGGILPPHVVLRRLYVAEVVKILLTAGSFLGALTLFALPFLPLLLGYGVTLAVHWLSLLFPPIPAHRSS